MITWTLSGQKNTVDVVLYVIIFQHIFFLRYTIFAKYEKYVYYLQQKQERCYGQKTDEYNIISAKN